MKAFWSCVLGAVFTGLVASAVTANPLEQKPLIIAQVTKGPDRGGPAPVQGIRAVTIAIDADSGAGGFILPNDRVDLMLKRNDAPTVSETVLSNVRVLAIDQAVEDKNGQKLVVGKTATIEVSPDQAESLAAMLVRTPGTLLLALHGGPPHDAKTETKPNSGFGVVRFGVTPTPSSSKGSKQQEERDACWMLSVLLIGDYNDPRTPKWIATCNQTPESCTVTKEAVKSNKVLSPEQKKILSGLTCPEPKVGVETSSTFRPMEALPEVDIRAAEFDKTCTQIMATVVMGINDTRLPKWTAVCGKNPNGSVCDETKKVIRDAGKQVKMTCSGGKSSIR
ncbi:MAG: pilus assembly protein CpaB [Alphaproteobacteria bacterium]|jgi:hypothetical protein|nr:pilus assembly protein CpaB [Alphaproteobacteria bacterium]